MFPVDSTLGLISQIDQSIELNAPCGGEIYEKQQNFENSYTVNTNYYAYFLYVILPPPPQGSVL